MLELWGILQTCRLVSSSGMFLPLGNVAIGRVFQHYCISIDPKVFTGPLGILPSAVLHDEEGHFSM